MCFDNSSAVARVVQRDIELHIYLKVFFLFEIHQFLQTNFYMKNLLFFLSSYDFFSNQNVIRSFKMKMATTKQSRAEQSKRKQKHKGMRRAAVC